MTSIPVHTPKQSRAKETYEDLLIATQEILSTKGIEAVSTNLIAEKAGVSPPSFYRYFRNKHEILIVLAERLQIAQNAVIEEKLPLMEPGREGFITQIKSIIVEIFELTRNFKGGFEITTAMHAIEELRPILETYQNKSANLTAKMIASNVPGINYSDVLIKCRLSTEMGYAAIELLLNDNTFPRELIAEQAAKALYSAIFE